MDITPWTVYWITRLDAIFNVAVLAAIVGLVTAAFLLVLATTTENERVYESFGETKEGKLRLAKKLRRYALPALAAGFLGAVAATLTPTTKEACAILAIPAIANSEDVQGLGADLVGLAREWLEELRPEGD